MEKISRYFLIIVAVIGFAIILPKFYWMIFSEPVRRPFIMYSCIDDNFMILRSVNKEIQRTDKQGNKYTREEYEQRLPLFYIRQLLMSKTMPDSINGIKMDPKIINKHRSSFRTRPKELLAPKPSLYPLFEAQSGRAYLSMPTDFFRINKSMEILDAKTNKILKEKSQIFNAVLVEKGFVFPAKSINGIPTTRKSRDEGYFIIDSDNQLFHLKKIQDKPYVVKINIPKNLTFNYIKCVDFKDKKFYAYLFSTDNKLYILTQNEYRLIPFPIDNINPTTSTIRILGDLFHYNIVVAGSNFTNAYAVDARTYQKVDEYKETWQPQSERKEGKIFQTLFPGQITMRSAESAFVNFYVHLNKKFYWIALSILLIIFQVIIIKKRKLKVKNQIVDILIIGFLGIFGFLAVNIFPNKW